MINLNPRPYGEPGWQRVPGKILFRRDVEESKIDAVLKQHYGTTSEEILSKVGEKTALLQVLRSLSKERSALFMSLRSDGVVSLTEHTGENHAKASSEMGHTVNALIIFPQELTQ